MTRKRYLATMAYSDSDDNDLFITDNLFSLGPSIRTAYLAAEDLLNIGLDDLVRGTKWRAGGGSGRGGVPPPFVEENGNQEMLRGLLKHTKIRILYGYIVYKY